MSVIRSKLLKSFECRSSVVNCCVTPSGSSDVKKKPNPYAADYGVNRGSGGSNKLVLSKDPTGHDINARYDLGREVGRAEFGSPTCALMWRPQRNFCKSISKKKLRTAVDIEDVRREVEIMKHMPKHPNIVTLKDTYEDDRAVHIVMELCEGGELFDRKSFIRPYLSTIPLELQIYNQINSGYDY